MYNHIIVTTTCERIFSLFNIFKDLCLYDNHLKDVAILRFFKVSQHQAWTRLSILLLKMNLNLRQKFTYQETLLLSRDHLGYQSKELVPRTAGR